MRKKFGQLWHSKAKTNIQMWTGMDEQMVLSATFATIVSFTPQTQLTTTEKDLNGKNKGMTMKC
jgi:hypothetical protein